MLWTVLGVALIVASASVAKAFTKFRMNLPDPTAAVVDFALVLRQFWYLGLLAVCPWPLANWGMVRILSNRPESFIPRRLWYLATWIIPLVAAIFAFSALMISLMALRRRC